MERSDRHPRQRGELMLPAYIDASRPLGVQAAIVMASVTATEWLGLTLHAAGADALAGRFRSPAFAIGFFRIAALAMVASAVIGVFATWR